MTKVARTTVKRIVKPTTEAAVLDRPRKASNGYKVFFEQVAAEKKELRLSDVTNPIPPRGYAFLAIGHPDLAEYCKEVSRQQDIPVSIVSAAQKQPPQAKISKHLHRIGYHFRQDIFDQGCQLLGYQVKNGKLHRDVLPNDMWGFDQITDGYGTRSDSADGPERAATEQEALATKLAIKELFPLIPHKDLEDIWRRAFRAGAQTVGNARNLPLSRRVQLATVAHARHQYTEYDRLLRVVDWPEARARVQMPCLAKLVEWRGEQVDDRAIEEVLREVIVIDDEEEEQHNGSSAKLRRKPSVNIDDSDTSLEIIAKPAAMADLAPGNETDGTLPKRYAKRLGIELPKLETGVQGPLRDDQRQALRARWQEARVQHEQMPPAIPLVQAFGHDDEIEVVNVPVDQFGRPPMKLVRDGVTYVRSVSGQTGSGHSTRLNTPGFAQPHMARQPPAHAEVIDLTSPPRKVESHPMFGQAPLEPPQFGQPSSTSDDTSMRRLQDTLGRGLSGGSWADIVQQSTEIAFELPRTTRSQVRRTSDEIRAVHQPTFGQPSLSRPVSSSGGSSAFSA